MKPEVSEMNLEDTSSNPMKSEDIEMFYHGLSKLPDLQRETLVLFEISGFSIAEIAKLQQSGVSAVKQRLARGRKAMLVILQAELAPKNQSV
ncbi:MAG: DNA-directed RNA polymerase specialized sigma24 family protein [Flavobacteriaceae bacterium]|jgi:DNA-directed RNA polymerase specialized sigma24 family protein